MSRVAENRRAVERIALAEPAVARFGTQPVVLLDISSHGARVEHYSLIERGAEKALRIRWRDKDLSINAKIVSSMLHRFKSGDGGATVYRSGLRFEFVSDSDREPVRRLISSFLASTLVEQVANARGFTPPSEDDMPIFRFGVLTRNQQTIQRESNETRLLPKSDLVHDQGYICFALVRGRWIKKWTADPQQPAEGFTVSTREAAAQIDMLCEQYRSSNLQGRQMIQRLAALSVAGGD